MTPPKRLVFLGYVTTLFVSKRKESPHEIGYSFPKRKTGLFTVPRGNVLWCLPIAKKREIAVPRGWNAEKKAFRDWHEKNPQSVFRLDVEKDCSTVKRNGFAVQIIYESGKWSNRLNSYIHHFESAIPVYNGPGYRAFAIGNSRGQRIVYPEGITG